MPQTPPRGRRRSTRPSLMESGGPDAWPPSPGGSRFQALSDGYTIPGAAILPLRLFLGLTFVYAGIQKLTDPGFFRAGSPTYIGAQILSFSRGSPIAFLLHHMMEQAVAVGVLTIMTEMTVGGLVLLGLFTRPAALVGLSLSLMFFLSASWHTYPYFFGSDIVFVMCWLTIALTGPGPLSLDPLVQPSIMKELQDRFGEPAGGVLRRILAVPLEPRAVSLEEQAVQGVGATTLRVQVNRAEALLAGAATLGLVLLGLHSRTGSASASQKLASSSRPAPLPDRPARREPRLPARSTFPPVTRRLGTSASCLSTLREPSPTPRQATRLSSSTPVGPSITPTMRSARTPGAQYNTTPAQSCSSAPATVERSTRLGALRSCQGLPRHLYPLSR